LGVVSDVKVYILLEVLVSHQSFKYFADVAIPSAPLEDYLFL